MSESSFIELLSDMSKKRWNMFLLGKGFYIKKPVKKLKTDKDEIRVATTTAQTTVVDTYSKQHHQQAAQAAFDKAREILQSKKPPEVLIIDEICNAIDDGLIDEQVVLEFIQQRGRTHLILTGRQASTTLIDACDLVTQMKKAKHPYDEGLLAIKGLDF